MEPFGVLPANTRHKEYVVRGPNPRGSGMNVTPPPRIVLDSPHQSIQSIIHRLSPSFRAPCSCKAQSGVVSDHQYQDSPRMRILHARTLHILLQL